MPLDLFDAIYGSLIGAAVGDALGAPVEGWHFTDIHQRYGKINQFLPQATALERATGAAPGKITDDSVLRHYLCLAIITKPGRINPDDYARIWLDTMNPNRLFVTERITLEKLKLGMNPWETGHGQLLADAALMSIAPVGLINAANPTQAYQDAYTLAAMHQDGIERDAAATIAACIATALLPGTSLDALLDAMLRHSSYQVHRLIRLALDTAEATGDIDAFVEAFYATMLDHSFPTPPGKPWEKHWNGPTSRETLPAIVGILRLCGQDINQCLIEAASFGRDADTIATVVGSITGALHGAQAIRPDLVAQCEAVNRDFFTEAEPANPHASFHTTARRMVQALHAERATAERQLATLTGLLKDPPDAR